MKGFKAFIKDFGLIILWLLFVVGTIVIPICLSDEVDYNLDLYFDKLDLRSYILGILVGINFCLACWVLVLIWRVEKEKKEGMKGEGVQGVYQRLTSIWVWVFWLIYSMYVTYSFSLRWVGWLDGCIFLDGFAGFYRVYVTYFFI